MRVSRRGREVGAELDSAVPGVHGTVMLQAASLGFVRKSVVVSETRGDDNVAPAIVGKPGRTLFRQRVVSQRFRDTGTAQFGAPVAFGDGFHDGPGRRQV